MNKKKYIVAFAAHLFCFQIKAQTDSLKWIKEINDQVWKPFAGYINTGDNAGLSSLHSKRIIRVGIDQGYIMDYLKYFPENVPKSNKSKEQVTRTFELRFDKRISDGSRSWETGYYKGTSKREGQELRTYYGRFYVVLEKENGTWKIIVDADTNKGVTEEIFAMASPIL